jgi:hypothetical protein
MRRIAHITTLALLLGTAPVLAQSALTDKIKRCAAVENDAERLACYDGAVAAVDAEAAKMAAERKAQAEQRKREEQAKAEADAKLAAEKTAKDKVDAFGAAGMPSDRRPEVKTDSIDELQASITEVFYSPMNQMILVLDNGQMWRQMDGMSVPAVRNGDKVVIKKRALSGFRLTFVRQKRTIDIKRYR